ncbi:MAG: DUF4330 family protein, partial [candidate division NC10 bacterium]|nr:DUF4330 family protein [candidate division NC10 bacterium]
MSLIDDRGRLFGKVNLIDAAVGLLFLLLIPLGYGAFVLFRPPAPQITAVEPSTLSEGKDLRVQLRGKNLRPFLRAFIGTQVAKGYLAESPNLAEVRLPDLGAGTYDLVLYDETQEVARRPGALTIVPPPLPPAPPSGVVQVRGTFTGLDKEGARALVVGARFAAGGQPPVAEVLALQPPEPAVERVKVGSSTVIATPVAGKVQVPAILRLHCTLVPDGCKSGDALVAPG